jgi:hypothetical protein
MIFSKTLRSPELRTIAGARGCGIDTPALMFPHLWLPHNIIQEFVKLLNISAEMH